MEKKVDQLETLAMSFLDHLLALYTLDMEQEKWQPRNSKGQRQNAPIKCSL